MSLTGEITHTDGSTETIVPSRSEEEYEFEKMDIASIYLDRPQANTLTLEEDLDEVELYHDGERLFAGVLKSVLRGDGEVELLLDSYERYAADGERSSGGLKYQNSPDTTIYSDAIDDIDQLEEGTIENATNNATFIFPFASPAKRIRTVAESTGSEVLYPPDKTIDIVESLGSDKTVGAGGTALSPDERNISGDFLPERESGDDRVTHLIMLGAGEGESQVQATLVPENDPRDYENEEKFQNVHRYTPEKWENGDRESWDARTNKDISDPDTLAELATTLIEEYNAEFLDVEVTVKDEDVALGDEFTIEHPEEQIEHDLRAVDVTRVIDKHGRYYEVIFSNRRMTRETEAEKEIKDTERYNRSFEGNNTTETAGPYEDAVDPQNNVDWVMNYYYPDEVEYEHRVKLHLTGRAYRAKSRGAASSGGSHSHSVSISSHTHSISIDDHTHSVTYGVPFHVHSVNQQSSATSFESSHDHDGQVPSDGSHNHSYDETVGIQGPSSNETDTTTSDSGGGTTTTSDSGGGTTTTSSSTTPSHTHDPEPGVIQFDRYPGEVEVIVNGSTVATGVGESDGQWSEEIDLAGELVPGTRNTIRIEADSIGEIVGQLDIDVYRQILGDG